jgi:hypothetical protein
LLKLFREVAMLHAAALRELPASHDHRDVFAESTGGECEDERDAEFDERALVEQRGVALEDLDDAGDECDDEEGGGGERTAALLQVVQRELRANEHGFGQGGNFEAHG